MENVSPHAVVAREQVLECLLDTALESCIVTSAERTILLVNPAFLQLTGFTKAELVGKKDSVLFPKEWRAVFTSHIHKQVLRGGTWSGELSFTSKSKHTFRLHGNVYPMFESEKKFSGAIIIGKSPFGDTFSQQTLWESDSILHQLFNTMSDAVVVFDTSGKIVMHNDAFHRLLGSAEQEIFATLPNATWIDAGELKRLKQALAVTEEGKQVSNLIITAKKKNKSKIVFSCNVTKLNDIADNLSGYVCTMRDVTNVHFSDELSKTHERIERLVAEVHRKTSFIDVINDIHGLALAKASVKKIFKTGIEGIKKIIEHDLAGIYVYDEAQKIFVPTIMSNQTPFSRKLARFPLTLGTGIIGTAALSGKVILVNNAQNDPRSKYPPDMKPSLEHFIAAPIKSKRTLYAVLVVSRNREPGFLEEEAQLVKSFADATTIALENRNMIRPGEDKH